MSVAALVSINKDFKTFPNSCRGQSYKKFVQNNVKDSEGTAINLHHNFDLTVNGGNLCSNSSEVQCSAMCSSFSENVQDLSESFQNVPREVIASLLESVSNDVPKATHLIQHVTKTLPGLRKKRRERDWGDMIDDQNTRAKRTHIHFSQSSQIKVDQTVRDDRSSGPFEKDTFDLMSVENHQSMNFASQEEEIVSDLQTTQEAKSNSGLSTAHLIKVLTRTVLIQNEKLRSMQQRCTELELENNQLRLKLEDSEKQTQEYRELNATLQYYVTTSNQTSNFDFSTYYDDKHINRDIY